MRGRIVGESPVKINSILPKKPPHEQAVTPVLVRYEEGWDLKIDELNTLRLPFAAAEHIARIILDGK
jgi:hypothetical protein